MKTVDEVKKIIGKRPRKQMVVMCHGTFDIVHPGHIRQLIYAKSKGDILVISVTIDKYVTKRPISPYVPQELRALNLAAFEIVDYVIIDSNETPIENLKKLQPDYFVKGFEYSLGGIVNPKTREELDTVESYGGEMLFSPGDIVYSSSNLITSQKPNLALEHLSTLMTGEKIRFKDLTQTIKKFNGQKVHVVGDVIVDKYSKCTILSAIPKSPAFEAKVDLVETYIGGAGVVAKHLASLGAEVTLTTVLGVDDLSKIVVNDLKKSKVAVNAIREPARPTTCKDRFLTETNQILFQIDKLDHTIINEKTLQKICKLVGLTPTSAVILSDFRHGIFNSETIAKISQSIPKRALKIADTQINHRWGNILEFPNFDLITPNEKEVRYALADQETTIRPLAQKIYNIAKCRYLILKLGENGSITYRSPGMKIREYFYMDSLANGVIDPIGAGDALLATSTLGLLASNNIFQASILGNVAAAIECSRLGNVPVTIEEITAKLAQIEESL